MVFDVHKIREQFPILSTKVGKYPLIYFDSGATSEKPADVIDRISKYYQEENANIHRGVHHLSQISTENYENAREIIRKHINAKHSHEIIFTSGTTGGINLVAQSYGKLLKAGDEVLITEMEHHSNIVPWHMLATDIGIKINYIPLLSSGELDLAKLPELITENTRLLAIAHISNSLGTINPIKEIVATAHQHNVKVLVDAAQSLQHGHVDVQDIDCDFLVFSGHKVYGPTGVGILYGKEDLLNSMPPYQGGGDMIKTVEMSGTTYNDLPHKFEAGTPNIVGGIGLGTALEWLSEQDMDGLVAHEKSLLDYASARVKEIDGTKIYGEAENKCSVLSFLVEGIHPYDIGTLLNQQGIAVRTGHHCTQPVMDYFGISGTIRASFSCYNTKEEIDQFIEALKKAVEILRG